LNSPWPRVHRRVRNSRLVHDGVWIGSSETLHHSQILIAQTTEISDAETALIIELEIYVFDYERILLPPAARISGPLRHVLRNMRTAINWNDPGFMIHFNKNCDVSRTLNDAVVAVVWLGKHGRSGSTK